MKPNCGAISPTSHPASTVVMTSPQGRRLTHQVASELAQRDGLIIVCGRYEGIDERDLVLRGQRGALVLKTVPGAHLDDGHRTAAKAAK